MTNVQGHHTKWDAIRNWLVQRNNSAKIGNRCLLAVESASLFSIVWHFWSGKLGVLIDVSMLLCLQLMSKPREIKTAQYFSKVINVVTLARTPDFMRVTRGIYLSCYVILHTKRHSTYSSFFVRVCIFCTALTVENRFHQIYSIFFLFGQNEKYHIIMCVLES